MAITESTNVSPSSTTWVYKKVRMRRPAGGQKARVTKSRRWFGRAPRDPREPLTIKISFRGGEECWYEVHARGEVGRFPGYVALHDVMREINRQG